jgi:CHAT domain-containing protein
MRNETMDRRQTDFRERLSASVDNPSVLEVGCDRFGCAAAACFKAPIRYPVCGMSGLTCLLQAAEDALSENCMTTCSADQMLFERLARLFDWLIRPIMSALEAAASHSDGIVVFVPHGELDKLPFAALRDGSKPHAPWLVQAFALAVVPGLAELSRCIDRWESLRSAGLGTDLRASLVVGNPSRMPHNAVALLGAEEEAIEVARILGGCRLLLRDEACKTNVLHALQSAAPPIVHLATHAVVHQDLYPAGAIFLASDVGTRTRESGVTSSGDTALENAILRAQEIGSLDLRARLCILSTCDAGRGLALALIDAGVPCSILSLWPVHDRATKELMIAFYAALLSGKTVAHSLRDAMLLLLDSDELADHRGHPGYWAAFLVSGLASVTVCC